MEMFRALLLPLQPTQLSPPPGLLEVNYDAILPATRRPLARSLPACRKAMAQIKDDLEAWRRRSEVGTGVSDGVAGEVGRGGLVGEMRREVKLVAVTPTKQEMKSSVGREVCSSNSSFTSGVHLPRRAMVVTELIWGPGLVLRFARYTSLLDAQDHSCTRTGEQLLLLLLLLFLPHRWLRVIPDGSDGNSEHELISTGSEITYRVWDGTFHITVCQTSQT